MLKQHKPKYIIGSDPWNDEYSLQWQIGFCSQINLKNVGLNQVSQFSSLRNFSNLFMQSTHTTEHPFVPGTALGAEKTQAQREQDR